MISATIQMLAKTMDGDTIHINKLENDVLQKEIRMQQHLLRQHLKPLRNVETPRESIEMLMS